MLNAQTVEEADDAEGRDREREEDWKKSSYLNRS